MGKKIIPLWIRIPATLWLVTLIPVYIMHYGVDNFLWFSNIAFILTVTSMWLSNRLLVSMQAVAVTIPESVWILGFLWGLINGDTLFGLTAYMFDDEIPLFIRGLSLYHLWLPPLIFYCVYKLGYDQRALLYQCAFGVSVLLLTYLVSDPDKNINWVHGLGEEMETYVHPQLYLIGVAIIFVLAVYWPTHLLLRRLFSR